MTTTKATRLALWGGLAIFLIGVLTCGGAIIIEANDTNPFRTTTQAAMLFILSLFFLVTGIIAAIAGAIMKAFKR